MDVHFPLLAIDPGLGGTGWALWETGRSPARIGIVRDTARDDLLSVRCQELCQKLYLSVATLYSLQTVVIEMPQQMSNRAGIAAQAGGVYKLAVLVGALTMYLMNTSNATVHVVTPSEWKGQLPKDVVQRRVEQRLGISLCQKLKIRSHAWDAVGLGLWAMGRL